MIILSITNFECNFASLMLCLVEVI